MSYEGYREYILADGRYVVNGAYEDETPEGAVWVHSVDVTNGYDESLPDCCDAPKEERGWLEHEHTDFKGNRYFTRESIYKPVGPHWMQLSRPAQST